MKDLGSDEITSDFCRELWNLRLKNINLKPEIDPENDFDIFKRYVFDPATRITTFWDTSGNLQGFYGRNLKVIQIHGKSYLRAFLEYGFMNIQFRGKLEFVLSFIVLGFRFLLKNFRLPKIAVGVAYPPSYITCKLNYPDIKNLTSSDLSVEQREILNSFLKEHFREGFDPIQNLVRMRTLPVVPKHASKNKMVQRAFTEYEVLNPRWKEGYALPILFEVNFKSFGSLLKRFVKSFLVTVK